MVGYEDFVERLVLLQDSSWFCWAAWFLSLLIGSARIHNMRNGNGTYTRQYSVTKKSVKTVVKSHPV